MTVGILTLHIYLPGCTSLKEKRRRIKPLLVRLHKEFNISVAEFDQMDVWNNATILCTLASNDHAHARRSLEKVISWIETSWPDVTVVNENLEYL